MREIRGKCMQGRLQGMSLGRPEPGVPHIYASVSFGTMHVALAWRENQKPSSAGAPQIWTNDLLPVNGIIGDDMRRNK